MTIVRLDDPRISGIRVRLRHLEIGWRWIGAAGVIKDDVAYLLRRYDERGEEIELLRRTLASMADGLPAAPEKGEHIANISNRTEGDGSSAGA